MNLTNRQAEGFIAGEMSGNYQLMFIQTSNNDRDLANQLAADLTGQTVKGFGEIGEAWGFHTFNYSVRQN